jgi:hypothetical protein
MSIHSSGYRFARIALMTVALAAFSMPPAHAQSTYTVDATSDGADANTADGICDDGVGACTLRAAIEQANATSGLDSIHFDIPGAGVHTIQPATLPEITDPVVVDGYTQAGASPNSNRPDQGSNAVILIAIDASLTNGAGLDISAGESTVRGLAIHSAVEWAIRLFTNGNNTVEGNFLGLNAAGDAAPATVPTRSASRAPATRSEGTHPLPATSSRVSRPGSCGSKRVGTARSCRAT